MIIGVVLEETRPIRPTMRPFADGSPLCLVRSSICWSVGAKNLDQLYSSINHHKTTANPSDHIFSEIVGLP